MWIKMLLNCKPPLPMAITHFMIVSAVWKHCKEAALTWHAHDGIAVGTATVFDREGPIGTSTVTSLANARRSVDFTKYDFGGPDDDQSFSTGA